MKNPFARQLSLPVELDVARPIGSFSRSQEAITFQPLIPFLLGPKWDLITQTVIPVLSQPDIAAPKGRVWGLSDISTSFYFTPDGSARLQWGIGPTLLMPAATNPNTGGGKWALGPTVAVVAEPGNWTLALVANHVKAFAGDRSRDDVHYSTLQYQVTHNFWRSWYVTTSPTSVVSWTAPAADRWLVPVGAAIGNVAGRAERQIGVEFGAYYSLVHPKTQPYAKWIWSLQVIYSRLINKQQH